MSAVSLADLEVVLESVEYDPAGDQPEGYVQRSTGQTFVFLAAEFACARGEQSLDELPEWQQELVVDAEKMVKNPQDFILVEPRESTHSYHVMRAFCESLRDDDSREDLLGTIHGRGAFSRFQRGLVRYDLQEQWYAWRRASTWTYLKEWCASNGLAYSEEEKPSVACL